MKVGDFFMACYHPNICTYKLSNGEKIYKFIGARSNYTEDYLATLKPYVEVPCGQCIGCRLEYSRQWATRCMLESSLYDYNYFVTLTYDDDHLLKSCYRVNYKYDLDSGEVVDEFDSFSLFPPDLTKFMKDLRAYFKYKYNEDNIRFFASGEYGEKSMRPHFHILLFNCNLRNLKLFGQRDGQLYYESDDIYKVWKNGLAIIGDVTFDSCAYVSRYIMKKQKGKNAFIYEDKGIIPEFVRMSRMPGIARSYYDVNKDKIYNFDEILVTGGYGKVLKVKPPRYYDKLYAIDEPDMLEDIKNERLKSGLNSERLRKPLTSIKDKSEYLAVKEEGKISQIKRLPRNLI